MVLIESARLPMFTEVFGIPPYEETDPSEYYENPERQKNFLYASMGDCQLVLRYFALRDEANIRGAMKKMLDRAMQVQITETEAQKWKEEFKERFAFLYQLFDGRPFRLPSDGKGRERVSAAIYDASLVAINNLWKSRQQN